MTHAPNLSHPPTGVRTCVVCATGTPPPWLFACQDCWPQLPPNLRPVMIRLVAAGPAEEAAAAAAVRRWQHEQQSREPVDLVSAADRIAAALDTHFDPEHAVLRQVLSVAEEAGEFVGAYRRAVGWARRPGDLADAHAELADVVITAYVTAVSLHIDLDAAIRTKLATVFTRGWRTGGGEQR